MWALIVPLCGAPFMLSTLQLSTPAPSSEDSFTLLSFNAKLFRRPGSYREFSMEMIDWTANDPADIKVIPEHSTDNRWERLDVNGKIRRHGYNAFSVSAPVKNNDYHHGSAIFSKFPTVGTGIVFTDSASISMAIFEDLVIKKDTIRIYSVHLASMQLHSIDFSRQTFRKLINGAMKRSAQLDKLIANIEGCSYPFIISGDFNETPYSYNYWRVRRYARDSFVDEGHGLGLSYSTEFPLARIDYLFVSDGIVVEDFSIEGKMRLSDHFPVRGRFRFDK